MRKIERAIREFAGVADLHALHVWSLGTGHDAITAHVTSKGQDAGLALRISDRLRDRFDVEYVTVQVEPES